MKVTFIYLWGVLKRHFLVVYSFYFYISLHVYVFREMGFAILLLHIMHIYLLKWTVMLSLSNTILFLSLYLLSKKNKIFKYIKFLNFLVTPKVRNNILSYSFLLSVSNIISKIYKTEQLLNFKLNNNKKNEIKCEKYLLKTLVQQY